MSVIPPAGLLRAAIRDGVVPPAESMEQDAYEEALAELVVTGRTEFGGFVLELGPS